MRYVPEAGDVVGAELRIAATNIGYQGVLQMSEGYPGELFLVNISVKDNTMTFTIDGGYLAGQFTGIIESDLLTGQLRQESGGIITFNLRRGKSYWD